MAIQMRRGLRKDFDPNKMLPGEWAVSIDSSTSNQIVWMCFATGVCKRMGTYEDFQNMVYQATGEIIERYEENFGQILAEVKEVANDVKSDKEEVIYIKSEITDTYLPQIRQYISSASSSANSASADAVKAKASADAAKASEQNAKKSEEKAKTYADNASAVTGVQIATKEIAGLVKGGDNLIDEDGTLTLTKSTTERTLTNSYAGGIKINEICGASEQYSGTITDEEGNEIAVPSPDYPQEIKSVEVSEAKANGKNLFNISDKIKGDYFTVGENGWITITLDNTTGTTTKYGIVNVKPSSLIETGKKYLLVCEIESITLDSIIPVSNVNDNLKGQFVNSVFCENVGVFVYNITSRSDFLNCTTMLRTLAVANAGSSGSIKFRLSVLEDTSVTASTFVYEPYQESIIKLSEPITLNGIGDTKDRIVRKDGVWGVERKFGNIVFDGSDDEKWFKDIHRLVTEMYVSKVKSRTLNVLCNMFSVATESETYTKTKEGISIDSVGRIYIYDVAYLDSSLEANINAWKAHLVEKQMTVLYELAEEVFEPLTEADQIALNSLVSFNTVTHIITDSGIEPIIDVEYGTSKVGAYTLDAWNTAKRNEIKNAQIEALITELATNTVAESEE